MLILRSFIFFLTISVFTICYGSICIIIFPLLSITTRYKIITVWCRITVNTLKIICGVRYRVVGLNNLPNKPAVFLSKHQSTWETIAFPALIPRPLCFVLKKSLLKIPFFGWTLAMTQMIHIDRSRKYTAITSIIKQGKQKLIEGSSIVLFPEGSRIPVSKIGKYQASGVHLAKATESLIIPIAHNAGTCWPHHSFIKKPGVITISIGKPIKPGNLPTEELNQIVKIWIENEIQRIDQCLV